MTALVSGCCSSTAAWAAFALWLHPLWIGVRVL
jgi:hypothetical protein